MKSNSVRRRGITFVIRGTRVSRVRLYDNLYANDNENEPNSTCIMMIALRFT